MILRLSKLAARLAATAMALLYPALASAQTGDTGAGTWTAQHPALEPSGVAPKLCRRRARRSERMFQ